MSAEKSNINIISKSWGFEKIICNQQYGGKLLYIIKGKQTPVHYHSSKDKTFYVSSGRISVYHSSNIAKIKELVDGGGEDDAFGLLDKFILTAGDSFHVSPKTAHCLVGLDDSSIFEFSNKYNDADVINLISGE